MAGSHNWTTPPPLRHKTDAGCYLLTLPFRLLIGAATTAILVAFLILITPILLVIRLILILKRRSFQHTSCDILWPLTPFSRACVFLTRNPHAPTVSAQVSSHVSAPSALCCVRFPSEQTEDVSRWDQRQRQMLTMDDLSSYLSRPDKTSSSACTIRLVSDFPCDSNEDECSSTCGLLLLGLDVKRLPLCALRLITALSEGHLCLELEPRLFQPFSSAHMPQLSVAISIFGGVFRTAQFIFLAPMMLIRMCFRRPNPAWRVIENTTPTDVVTIRREGRSASLGRAEGEAVNLMAPPPPVISLPVGEDGGDPGQHFNWMMIEQLDLLQRAERLLRATTMELMASLMAGAIRSYFREEGIRHPPCVAASIPVCTDENSYIGQGRRCRHLLLPVLLPTGVEGAIPRLWTLQRRLANVVESVTPSALKAAKKIGAVLLPGEQNRRLNSLLYGDCVVQMSYVRVGGESLLDDNSLHSLLLVPPLVSPTRASFSWVQSQNKLMLAYSLDAALFPRPQKIISLFQMECAQLLDHLSFRLLTLTQTTFLPERMPIFRVEEDEDDSYDAYVFEPPPPGGEAAGGARLERCPSQGQLEKLLNEVQNELDRIRTQPRPDREADIRKLTELEERMENFHKLMEDQVGSSVIASVEVNAMETSSAVAELLAPYRRQSTSGRRFSREFLRMDAVSSSRRNSRSSNTSS